MIGSVVRARTTSATTMRFCTTHAPAHANTRLLTPGIDHARALDMACHPQCTVEDRRASRLLTIGAHG
jgi:hypothetical protein